MVEAVAQSISFTQLSPFPCSNHHRHHLPLKKAQTVNLGSFDGRKFSLHSGAFIPFHTSSHSRDSLLCFCCTVSASSKDMNENSNNDDSETCSNWDWNRWKRHFSEIEKAESSVSALKCQLEDAIEKEDFEGAAELKMIIKEVTSKHNVAEIMSELKNAIQEERFEDASRLSRHTGSGLVGWWVGYSKDSDDPFGRLIHITPSMGRFVGRSYSPSQLATSALGTPILEIYVVKDTDGTYLKQVVYLEQVKGNSTNAYAAISANTPNKSNTENGSSMEVLESNGKNAVTIEKAAEGRIASGINFLKERIVGLMVKVMNKDNYEVGKLNEIQRDGVTPGADNDAFEEVQEYYRRLYLHGVVLHDTKDISTKDEIVRLPARIEDMDKSSFILQIPERSADPNSRLIPPEDFWTSDDVSEICKVHEIVKLTNCQEQNWSTLSNSTSFSRITTSSADPFDGLYVGTYGPYGTGIVQLKRRFGHWNSHAEDDSSDVKFLEYVEAVKLTGDLNIPAGQVTFRAKLGKRISSSKSGINSNDLGGVAIYEGQGRMAEFGFQNSQWVYGELIQLDGKVMEPYLNGADICFLFYAPDGIQHVMFVRLKLPELRQDSVNHFW